MDKTNKRIAAVLGMLVAIAAPLSGSMAADKPPVEASQVSDATVTVQSVDVPNRMLVVKDQLGVERTMVVPAEVKRLAEIKPGDKIHMRYHEALAVQMRKPGDTSPRIQSGSDIVRAEGDSPAGMVRSETKTVITVKSTDTANNTLTFVGPQGQTRTVAVERPEGRQYLKTLKPGDEVEVIYREALAVAVDPSK